MLSDGDIELIKRDQKIGESYDQLNQLHQHLQMANALQDHKEGHYPDQLGMVHPSGFPSAINSMDGTQHDQIMV